MANETIKRWSILASLLVIALWLAWTAPEKNEGYDVVGVNSSRTASTIKKNNTLADSFEMSQPAEIQLSKRTTLNEKPFDIFGAQKAPLTKRVVTTVKKPPRIKTVVAAAPSAPRIPFRYIGQLAEKGRVKVFLMEGDALHLVSKGDMIGKIYQITEVNVDEIRLLYLPLDITQVMSIGRAP